MNPGQSWFDQEQSARRNECKIQPAWFDKTIEADMVDKSGLCWLQVEVNVLPAKHEELTLEGERTPRLIIKT